SARSAHGAFMPRPFFPNGRKIKQPISKREGPCRYLGAPLPFIHSGGRPLAKIFLRQSPRHSAADYWSCTIGDGREIRSGADQRASFVCADTTGEASSAPVLRSFSVPLCNWPSPRLRSASFLMPPLYPRECAVDPHAAVITFAPSRSTDDTGP